MSTDPTNLEADDPLLSTDSAHSTYAAVDPEPDNPPAGTRVEETRGYPPVSGGTSTKKSSSTSSSASSGS